MSFALGILGGGNMAEAIVRGAIAGGVLTADDVIVSDPAPPRRAVFEAMGATVTQINVDVVERAQRILLAVKPQVFESLSEATKLINAREQLVMSIMAGVSSGSILAAMGGSGRVIRVMPNTPLQVGQGASAIARAGSATDADEQYALVLFGAAGQAVVVDESMMDAVTALSGSGPAYVFYLAEAMTEGAIAQGMDPALADRLTRQTILGAAALLTDSPEPACELRRRVTSPGGTTQAAIEHMHANNVDSHIANAIAKAAKRSKELGQ